MLTCGGRWLDLDAMEYSRGYTPLHLTCRRSDNQKILQILLHAGCHTDCVDRSGRTPLDLIKNSEMQSLFLSERVPSKLKCLCARLVVEQQLNLDSLGSSVSALNKFVLLHGYRS